MLCSWEDNSELGITEKYLKELGTSQTEIFLHALNMKICTD